MSEQGQEPAVVLTQVARGARAALGPTAWVVLEELTLGAERGRDGRLVATTSVRRLGAASAGFLFRIAAGRPTSATCYVVASISGLARVGGDVGVGAGSDSVLPVTAVRPSDGDSSQCPEVGDGARPRRSRRTPDGDGGPAPRAGQLSLLDDDVAPNDPTTSSSSPTPHPLISTTDAPKDPAHSTPNTEPDDNHHHRFAISPIRTSDSCHPSGEASTAGPGGSGGGAAHPC